MYFKNNLQLQYVAKPKVQCGRHRSASDLEGKNENIFWRKLEKQKGEKTLKQVSPRLTETPLPLANGFGKNALTVLGVTDSHVLFIKLPTNYKLFKGKMFNFLLHLASH